MAKPMPPEVEPQNLNHWATKEASLLCVCVTVQGRTLPAPESKCGETLGSQGLTAGALSKLVIQSLSRVQLSATSWTAARQASLSFTVFRSLLSFMSTESAMLSNHLFLCHPLLLLPSVFPNIRVFPSESALPIRQSKYQNLGLSSLTFMFSECVHIFLQ